MEDRDIVVSMVSGALSSVATASEEEIVEALKSLTKEERWKLVRAAWAAESIPTKLPISSTSVSEDLGILGK